MTSPYQNEREMYEPVRAWLEGFLTERFREARVRVYDASSIRLSNLIDNKRLYEGLSPDWATWEIKIDVVGFVHEPEKTHIAFVECKNTALSLNHLAQLLGYARIAQPNFAFLISPLKPTGSLSQLLGTYQRLDVLEYTHETDKIPRSIIIARWNAQANAIVFDSTITTDAQKVGLGRF